MRARLLALRKTIATYFGPSKKKFATSTVRCDAHMNELPIPCGPWEIYYKDRQSFYQKHLIFGALWFAFSIFAVIYTESLFFNWYPPLWPDPPYEMGEVECESVD